MPQPPEKNQGKEPSVDSAGNATHYRSPVNRNLFGSLTEEDKKNLKEDVQRLNEEGERKEKAFLERYSITGELSTITRKRKRDPEPNNTTVQEEPDSYSKFPRKIL